MSVITAPPASDLFVVDEGMEQTDRIAAATNTGDQQIRQAALVFENLALSLVLVPLAPLGVRIGHWLVQRSEARLYYSVISVFLVVLGGVLIYRSLSAQ